MSNLKQNPFVNSPRKKEVVMDPFQRDTSFNPTDYSVAGKSPVHTLTTIFKTYARDRLRYAEMGALDMDQAIADLGAATAVLKRLNKEGKI